MSRGRSDRGAALATIGLAAALAAGNVAADPLGDARDILCTVLDTHVCVEAAGCVEAQETAAVQTVGAQEATQEQIDGFKKAFSACMEGKNYIAKF